MSYKKITEIWSEPAFDLKCVRYYLGHCFWCTGPLSRTDAFARAKSYRSEHATLFVRTLKVGNDYFNIFDENEYNTFWEARKIALRNERRMKNEII